MAKGINAFTHDSDAAGGMTVSVLRGLFGNDGYAFWFITLECMAQSENMCIDCSNRIDWLKHAAKCGVSEEKADSILNVLCDIGAIDADLWKKKRIIWSDAFVERVKSKLVRRQEGLPDKPEINETPKPAKKAKIQKKQYSEFVSMTEEQYNELNEQYGIKAVNEMIRVLDNYKGCSGKKYKDDYRAILNWVVDKVRNEKSHLFIRNPYNNQSENPFGDFDISEEFRKSVNG